MTIFQRLVLRALRAILSTLSSGPESLDVISDIDQELYPVKRKS